MTLSTVKSLKMVKIEPSKATNTHFSVESLTPLLKDCALDGISLSRVRLQETHISLLADTIKNSDHFRSIALTSVGLTDAGAVQVGEALSINNSLTAMDLSNNDIGDVGIRAIAEGLKNNTSVKQLRLWGNKEMKTDSFAALAEMLQSNNTIERLETPSSDDSNVRVKIDECLTKNRRAATAA